MLVYLRDGTLKGVGVEGVGAQVARLISTASALHSQTTMPENLGLRTEPQATPAKTSTKFAIYLILH